MTEMKKELRFLQMNRNSFFFFAFAGALAHGFGDRSQSPLRGVRAFGARHIRTPNA